MSEQQQKNSAGMAAGIRVIRRAPPPFRLSFSIIFYPIFSQHSCKIHMSVIHPAN